MSIPLARRGPTCLIVTLALAAVLGGSRLEAQQADPAPAGGQPAPPPGTTYTPTGGFRLATTDQGVVNVKLYTYARYLNQRGLDDHYTDTFGTPHAVKQRQDIQLQKINLQFFGWVMNPKLRYLAYVWTANTSIGQTTQVVVGGNLSYDFSRAFRVTAGIISLPGTRTTEGNFPFWLSTDNRLIADEFFRPSYTTGISAKGDLPGRMGYAVMLGNNLSQFGVDAGQLDNKLDTFAAAFTWMPTTGEFGRGFGDYEQHERVATRVAAHFTRSDENNQAQPDTEAIDNVQLRLSDGSVIFTPGLFGEGIRITDARYRMTSVDGGVKYRGLAVEGELYRRSMDHLRGANVDQLAASAFRDWGFQLQASAMVAPRSIQAYLGHSRVSGEYGDPWDLRVGTNWYPLKNQVVTWNFEYLYLRHSPVGALSLPYAVGGNGPVFYSSFQLNF